MDGSMHRVTKIYSSGMTSFLAVLIAGLVPLTVTAQIALPVPDVSCAVTTVAATSAADFAAGAAVGTMITETDNGEESGQLRLVAPLNDLFLAPELDPMWLVTLPAAGFTPVIEGGVLDAQERDDSNFELSGLESQAAFSGGATCEMRAMINPGSAYSHLGFFSSTTTLEQWLYFSTRGTGDELVPVINTSVRTGTSGTISVPTSVTLGEWHVFKIVWAADVAEFFVDGVLVDTRTGLDITLPQHFGTLKSSGSESSLLIDWVRITPYSDSPGGYESAILDAGAPDITWTDLDWQGAAPDSTQVQFETRTGQAATPDGSWSAWSALAGGSVVSPSGRYLQYRATLTSTDLQTSPVVDAIQLTYSFLDETPPTVTVVTPASTATDVLVGTPVTATFDEAIDEATLTDLTFTLTPLSGLPVAATVTSDAATLTATLTPAAPLAFATTYEARLTTGVADLDGNALSNDHAWTFTTVPPDLTAPVVIATVPATSAANVLASRLVTATFSEAVDPATLSDATFTVTPQGGAPVAAWVSYDAGSFRAILEPATDLALGTTYEVRLNTAITDQAGNPLAQDEVWSFTTRPDAPLSLLTTSAADFAAGSLTGIMITEIDSSSSGGQVRLESPLNDVFADSTLGAQWHATRPEGYTPVINDGILDVQEPGDDVSSVSAIESYQSWGPGVVLEARAMFVPGSCFIDVGLDASTYVNPQYAWFSTNGTGNLPGEERITARVREYDHTTVAIDTDATYNEWHVFKIIWIHGRVDFFIDGALVATHTEVIITAPMHAALFKSNDSDTPFYIDWIRVTPYLESQGIYESPVQDSGTPAADWVDLEWSGTASAATSVVFETRTGETAAPDTTWSTWSAVDGNDVTSPLGRYAQYRALLATTDQSATPVIDDVHLCYVPFSDMTPPAVLATTPPAGEAAVESGTLVTARFSEAINIATLTAASFTLCPVDGSAVAATVSFNLDSLTATLVPDTELESGIEYEARLTTAITDLVGNALPEDVVWTFSIDASVDVAESILPAATVLLPNAPNPFNPATTIYFDLARSGPVRLKIYGVDGGLVRTLISGTLDAGRHTEVWDGRDDAGRGVPSGTYLMRLEATDAVQIRKMLMLK